MQDQDQTNHSRRRFLGFFGASAGLLAAPMVSAKSAPPKGARSLSLHNLHTGEKLSTDFWIDGHYQPDALAAIDRILRDHRSDQARAMDRGLVDLLHGLTGKLGSNKPVEIISGYRSPATNAMLRAKSSGVAKKSYHTRGMALDIRVPDRELSDVYYAARAMNAGGVGYYGRSRFVHIDVGPIRTWGAKPKRA